MTNLSVAKMVLSVEQAANMFIIMVTCDVSKEPTSRDWSDEQPENMPAMLVALDVSKEPTSRDWSDEQPSNMLYISLTLDVSSFERSIRAQLGILEKQLDRY